MSGFLAPLPSLLDNPIINGDFNIWQRGVSFVSPASGSYLADRYHLSNVSTATHTITRSTNVPTNAGRLLQYSMQIENTLADAAVAASDNTIIAQRIEGYNFLPFAQRPFWLYFWAFSSVAGTYCFSARNSASDRSFVKEFVLAANTWTLVQVAVPASPSGGTWDYTNGLGLNVAVTLMAGTDFNTTEGAWQTGNFIGTANQVNWNATLGAIFRMTGVRMTPVPWPYNLAPTRTFAEEVVLCQRYFEKGGFNSDVAPAAGVSSAAYVAATWAANNASMQIPLQTLKRSAPTITIYGGASGGTGNLVGLLVSGSWVNSATSVAERIEQTNFGVAVTYTGLTYGDAYLANLGWTASSEL